MKPAPRIHAVIAVHNRVKLTLSLLHQLEQQSRKPDLIVLVDDGSTDGTSEKVSAQYPNVRIIRGPGDWYWTRSMHMGVKEALQSLDDHDYILVLNDDLTIPTTFVESLLQAAQQVPHAAVHAVNIPMDSSEPRILFGGLHIDWLRVKFTWVNQGRLLSEFEPNHLERTDLAWGRGFLVPAWAVRKAGNYDFQIPHRGDNAFAHALWAAGCPIYVAYGAVARTYDRKQTREYRLRDLKKFFLGIRSEAHLWTLYRTTLCLGRSKGYKCYYFLMQLSRLSLHFIKHLKWRRSSFEQEQRLS